MTPEAEQKESPVPPVATGFGYDVHRFEKGRPLILGGVEVTSEEGLAGHSDADVILHALCDALLGAAGLPDIGHYFPNSDPTWKDADSRVLLREVMRLVSDDGWLVGNADIAVVAEKPKLAPCIAPMKEKIAEDLCVSTRRVGIKATTNEKMGFIGRGEGIAAFATVLLYQKK